MHLPLTKCALRDKPPYALRLTFEDWYSGIDILTNM